MQNILAQLINNYGWWRYGFCLRIRIFCGHAFKLPNWSICNSITNVNMDEALNITAKLLWDQIFDKSWFWTDVTFWSDDAMNPLPTQQKRKKNNIFSRKWKVHRLPQTSTFFDSITSNEKAQS